jgi:Polyketide cyclase / dehydrase and lipid transport
VAGPSEVAHHEATASEAVTIAASPDDVWAVVSDPSVCARFSSELIAAGWAEGSPAGGVGAVIHGRSRHAAAGEWETTSFVTEWEPGRCLAWVVGSVEEPAALWRFDIGPDGGQGVVLRQTFTLGPGPSGLTPALEAMPEKADRILARRLQEHGANMRATLEGIRGLVE